MDGNFAHTNINVMPEQFLIKQLSEFSNFSLGDLSRTGFYGKTVVNDHIDARFIHLGWEE